MGGYQFFLIPIRFSFHKINYERFHFSLFDFKKKLCTKTTYQYFLKIWINSHNVDFHKLEKSQLSFGNFHKPIIICLWEGLDLLFNFDLLLISIYYLKYTVPWELDLKMGVLFQQSLNILIFFTWTNSHHLFSHKWKMMIKFSIKVSFQVIPWRVQIRILTTWYPPNSGLNQWGGF